MNKKEIKVFVKIKNSFVSTNSLYNAKLSYVAGKPVARIYKNPQAKVVEEQIRDQLRAVDFSDYIDFLTNTKQFKLLLNVILKKNIKKKDTSNFIKNIEDCWTRFVKEDLGISRYDDSLHVEVHAYKCIIPGASEEIACIQLCESDFNTRFDIIPQPSILWTEDSIKEDKTFKKLLKEKNIKLAKNKEESDTKFLFIESLSMDEGFDLIELIHDYPSNKFLFIGLLGECNDIKNQIIKRVENLKCGFIKASYINNKEDIFKLL